MAILDFDVKYPINSEYEFSTQIRRLDLDEEMKRDMEKGKGFFIKEPEVSLSKTIKRTDSIFSEKFTKTLQDSDAFADRYSCKCKKTQGRDYKDSICPYCHTKVQYVGDDLEIFGWINFEPYHIIHPNLFITLSRYIGKSDLEAILLPEIELDENGNPITNIDKSLIRKKRAAGKKGKKINIDTTYVSLGLIEFYNRFDEILEYFHSKNKNKKQELYDDLIANRDKIFIQNIPVYSSILRPWKIEGRRLTFEATNTKYTIIAKQAAKAKDDSYSIYRNPKYKNSVLWDIQERYNSLTEEIITILSGKKGRIRSLIGGRCGFTSRSVIVPGPDLKVDEVRISYYSLLELLQQTIINILMRTYNIGAADAYMRFFRARLQPDKQIKSIIQNLIDTVGINVLVNRN